MNIFSSSVAWHLCNIAMASPQNMMDVLRRGLYTTGRSIQSAFTKRSTHADYEKAISFTACDFHGNRFRYTRFKIAISNCEIWISIVNWESDIWGVLHQKQVSRVGTSNYILQYLCGVITCTCPWHLHLAQHSWCSGYSPVSWNNVLKCTMRLWDLTLFIKSYWEYFRIYFIVCRYSPFLVFNG